MNEEKVTRDRTKYFGIFEIGSSSSSPPPPEARVLFFAHLSKHQASSSTTKCSKNFQRSSRRTFTSLQ
ncbi:hypothetical protein DERP_014279 [Dermatophagoides pteronyssinus]|uniref:Uncharacterized protein n=1 Tax=Dermatophagoides pteronyssinus TaxID=6956 RepID=A0ABQ8IXS0_DERPT|nr:hypothetical protein DERP_014279 [Dermatophagoides pteronyssinus]